MSAVRSIWVSAAFVHAVRNAASSPTSTAPAGAPSATLARPAIAKVPTTAIMRVFRLRVLLKAPPSQIRRKPPHPHAATAGTLYGSAGEARRHDDRTRRERRVVGDHDLTVAVTCTRLEGAPGRAGARATPAAATTVDLDRAAATAATGRAGPAAAATLELTEATGAAEAGTTRLAIELSVAAGPAVPTGEPAFGTVHEAQPVLTELATGAAITRVAGGSWPPPPPPPPPAAMSSTSATRRTSDAPPPPPPALPESELPPSPPPLVPPAPPKLSPGAPAPPTETERVSPGVTASVEVTRTPTAPRPS